MAFRLLLFAIAFGIFTSTETAIAQQDLLRGVLEDIVRKKITGALNNPPGQSTAPPQSRSATPAIPAAPVQPPPQSAGDVRQIQTILSQLGYDPGPADGMMGRRTRTAIQAFERDSGLSERGQPSREVQGALRSALANWGGPKIARAAIPPSFSCSRAGKPTEHAICASDDLAALDRALAATFKTALARTGAAERIRGDQRVWVERRDACGSSTECIAATMRQRIAELGGAVPAPLRGPLPGTDGGSNPIFASGQPLDGNDAYAALLGRYVRSRPEVVQSNAFRLNFAGLGCRADGWERQQLNPFSKQEILAASEGRLDALRAATDFGQMIVVANLQMTVGAYDLETETFPFAPGGGIQSDLRPRDFCRTLARDEGVILPDPFPLSFDLAVPGGAALGATSVADLMGGAISVPPDLARSFYEKGFPALVVRITGTAGTPQPTRNGSSQVPFTPLNAEIRAAIGGSAQPLLAILDAKDFVFPEEEAPVVPDVMSDIPLLTSNALVDVSFRLAAERFEIPELAAKYAYWDDAGGCLPEADIRGKPGEEFLRARLLEAAPELAAAKLAARPDLRRFRIVADGELGTYDIEQGSFPVRLGLSNGRPDEAQDRFRYGMMREYSIPDCGTGQGPKLRAPYSITVRDMGVLARLAMPADAAEALARANPERRFTATLVVSLNDDAPMAPSTDVIHMVLEQAEMVDAVTGQVLMRIAPDFLQAHTAPGTAWDDAPEIDYELLLIQLARSQANKLPDAAFGQAYLQSRGCQEFRSAQGNPITQARLSKTYDALFAERLGQPVPPYVRAVFSSQRLDEYDLAKEVFPYRPHGEYYSFATQKRQIEPNNCKIGPETEVPGTFWLEFAGLDETIAMGMPMPIEEAEAFIDREFANNRNQFRIEVLAEVAGPVRLTQRDNIPGAIVPVTARGVRVYSSISDEIVHEVSLRQPEKSLDPEISEATPDAASPTLALLGISLGASEKNAQAALEAEFGAEALSWPDPAVLLAETGPCLYRHADDPEIAEEIGSSCAAVSLDPAQGVTRVFVRNVIPGSLATAAEAQFTRRFGAPQSRVEGVEPSTLILGWGEPVNGPLDEFPRDTSLGQDLRELEARVSEAHGVTLITLRLDLPDAPEGSSGTAGVADEPEAPAPVPEIKF